LKEWTAPDCRNTPSTTNLEDEEIVDAAGSDGNASMPEKVKRPNTWRKMMMIFIKMIHFLLIEYSTVFTWEFVGGLQLVTVTFLNIINRFL